MKSNKLVHFIYSILGSGTLLLTTIPPSFAGSLPSCLRVVDQSASSITVKNDCNKSVRYFVVSRIALTPCRLIRPKEVQTSNMPQITGIGSCG